jgi:hypothetical protein
MVCFRVTAPSVKARVRTAKVRLGAHGTNNIRIYAY